MLMLMEDGLLSPDQVPFRCESRLLFVTLLACKAPHQQTNVCPECVFVKLIYKVFQEVLRFWCQSLSVPR